MKVDIDKFGRLTITPENNIEAFALDKWQEEAMIQFAQISYDEKFHYKGSCIALMPFKEQEC